MEFLRLGGESIQRDGGFGVVLLDLPSGLGLELSRAAGGHVFEVLPMVFDHELPAAPTVVQGLQDLVEAKKHQVLRDRDLVPVLQAFRDLAEGQVKDGDGFQQQENRPDGSGHQLAGFCDVPFPAGTFPERQFPCHLLRGVLVGEQIVQAVNRFAAEEGHQQSERNHRAGGEGPIELLQPDGQAGEQGIDPRLDRRSPWQAAHRRENDVLDIRRGFGCVEGGLGNRDHDLLQVHGLGILAQPSKMLEQGRQGIAPVDQQQLEEVGRDALGQFVVGVGLFFEQTSGPPVHPDQPQTVVHRAVTQAGPEQADDPLDQVRQFLVIQGASLRSAVLELVESGAEASLLSSPAGWIVSQNLEQHPRGAKENPRFETQGRTLVRLLRGRLLHDHRIRVGIGPGVQRRHDRGWVQRDVDASRANEIGDDLEDGRDEELVEWVGGPVVLRSR